jgi:DNA (cytosine-5)-methyltransferase 1
MTYYNEIEPYPAQWIRNLIDIGHLPPGLVDERDIQDVTPNELLGYNRCHFFAGIAGWEYALRLAGWPEELPVLTGSCPCQPFSTAGKRGGGADERHLWPAWFWLIRQCRPAIIFGEQVASKDGLSWLDVVFSDLGAEGYSCGAADLCAASVGAPHIRQRFWWVAHNIGIGSHASKSITGRSWFTDWQTKSTKSSPVGELGDIQEFGSGTGLCDCGQAGQRGDEFADTSATGILADTIGAWECRGDIGRPGASRREVEEQENRQSVTDQLGDRCEDVCRLADTGLQGLAERQSIRRYHEPQQQTIERGSSNQWADCEWLPCRDGKARPNEPGLHPLAHGIPQRVGRLRAYGNSIVPQVAAEFVKIVMAYLMARDDYKMEGL